ncbi:NRAMP metal ion transporter family protein [Wolffia australiana]
MAPQIFPSLGPALMISMGYIDLGKWVAAVEGAASFGFSLLPLVIFLNCCAIFCQYLSASVGVATKKNLAQIYSAEYSRSVCVTLGLQAEISAIAVDISSILGVAHGLSILSGLELVPCIFLSIVLVVGLPFLIGCLDDMKAEVLCLAVSGFALLFYVLGVLICQPEVPLAFNGIFPKLTGETAYSVMALLGSNIMVHHFYAHSSAVQNQKRATNVTVDAIRHDHFLANLFVFSGIFLVNYVLVNSSASVFHNSGLTVSTFHDVFLLLDQVFRIPIHPIALVVVLLFSSAVTGLSWKIGGQVILQDLLHVSFSPVTHQVLVRSLAASFVFLSTQCSSSEGTYQLLILCQVVSAMLIPSSVIPLFRVASSRTLMGSSKISWHLEILALVTFFGILASNIIFIMELLFGYSDWVLALTGGNGGLPVQFLVVLLISCFSLALTLYLTVTPLKSASQVQDFQMWALESHQDLHPQLAEALETEQEQKEALISDREHDVVSSVVGLEEPLFMNSLDIQPQLDVEDGDSLLLPPVADLSPLPSPESAQDRSRSDSEQISGEEIPDEVSALSINEVESPSLLPTNMKDLAECNTESIPPMPVAASKVPPLREKPGGTETAKPSGLGRSGRRTFAAVLDEFWGALFDLHGKVTLEAVARRLDILLGLEQKPTETPTNADVFPGVAMATKSPLESAAAVAAIRPFIPPGGDYIGPSSYLSRMSPTSLPPPSSTLQLLNSLGQSSWSSHLNSPDAGERRYSSLRLPQNNSSWDYQPATIHGHQISSAIRGISGSRLSNLSHLSQDVPDQKRADFFSPNYRDALGYKNQSQEEDGFYPLASTARQASYMELKSPLRQSSTLENGSAAPVYGKKYHSLPDISGFSPGDQNSQWGPIGRNPRRNSPIPQGGGASFADVDFSSPWSAQPFDRLFVPQKSVDRVKPFSYAESEAAMVQSLKSCLRKLLKLEGSEWLFRQDGCGGADEWLIEQIVAKEQFLAVELGETAMAAASLAGCGEGCVWRMSLVVSFGVWCIIRILELSQLESRPELWGKYTYVLNRLQGILELAFSRGRPAPAVCMCLNMPGSYQRSRVARVGCTSGARILEIVKDVELAISGRRGRTGTAAGDIAFPKGKENLASVLKRYKRRLSVKPPAPPPPSAVVVEQVQLPRRVPLSTPPPGF